ncbi:MAG: hypothetical protein GX238_07770 [Epulopiscium sp.]|nr:hypothetical protein [Candidatus Epulonipiscium sp.]
MGKIKKRSIAFLVTLLAGTIIGAILGTVVLNALISYRIDQYVRQIQYLEGIIQDQEIRFKKLEESINNKKLILKDIKIFLIYEDEMDKIVLEKYIKEKYTSLLGKEIKTIDVDLVTSVIDKRIMKISGKEYQLKVTKIILTDTLAIWIQLRLL